MARFTPIFALLGGLLLLCGRRALARHWPHCGHQQEHGQSLARTFGRGCRAHRLHAGLIVAPMVYVALAGAPAVRSDASLPGIIAGGLQVGFGTRLGVGCTSGRGICGLARFSTRNSIVASGLFMFTGFITRLRVAVRRERLIGCRHFSVHWVRGHRPVLVLSQLVNPAKALGFLDITGGWDLSLARVGASTTLR